MKTLEPGQSYLDPETDVTLGWRRVDCFERTLAKDPSPCSRLVSKPAASVARRQHGFDALPGERNLADAGSRRIEDRVPDRGGHNRDGGLPRSCGLLVRAVDENGLDCRKIRPPGPRAVAAPVDGCHLFIVPGD